MGCLHQTLQLVGCNKGNCSAMTAAHHDHFAVINHAIQ